MGRHNNDQVGPDDRKPQDRKLTRPGSFTVVLLKPRIPQNTGTIARMCAATGCRLDLIAPLFEIDDRKLARAGLDYWHLLDVRVFESWESWKLANPGARPWMVEVAGPSIYSNAKYSEGDFLMFGDEQDGIDPAILALDPERNLRIPQQGVRSLNLAMSVGIVTYESLRQVGWLGLEP